MSVKWVLSVTGVLLISFVLFSPAVGHSADVIKWRAQSAWAPGPGIHVEASDYFAKTLNRLTGGRLIIERFMSAGELVGAFETIPACAAGKLDIVHSTMMYMIGKYPAGPVACGAQLSPLKSKEELLSWWYKELDLNNQYMKEMGLNVVVFPLGPIESEPFWSNKPVKTLADFKGLKVRTSGLSLDFYKKLGAATVTMPLSEVVPSLDKGVIDACEWMTPISDYPAGVHKVTQYVLKGLIHQPCHMIELFINRDSWNKLPDDLKQTVMDAVNLTNMRWMTEHPYQNAILWQKMIKEGKKGGLIVTDASPEMQKRFFEIGEEMAKEWSAKDPWIKKFIDNQTEFHKDFVQWMGINYRNYPPK